jgi:hypothetical protein
LTSFIESLPSSFLSKSLKICLIVGRFCSF